MLKLKHILLLLLVLGGGLKIQAQYITPIGISNYGAVHSLHINPSMSAYSAYNWHINLAGAWVNVNNNYLTLKMPFSAYKYLSTVPPAYQTESGNPTFDKNWLHERLNGRPKQVGISADVYGPSASVKIKSWRVGLVTSAHATARISNLPENLAHAVYKEFDSTQGAFNQFRTLQQGGANTISKFAVVGNSRVAAGINIAKAIQLDWNRQLLVGVTVKKNWGMPGFYLQNSGMVLNTVNTDSVVFQPTKLLLVTYGDQIGKGMGVDIGATYVFNKKDTKRQGGYKQHQTRYFAKFGASIMDIGKITYKNATFQEVSTTQPIGISVDAAFRGYANGSGNYQALADSFMNRFATYKTYKGDYVVGLPTRLVLSADFQVRRNLFIGSVLTQSLRKKMSPHARYQSALMVAPRWEYRFFEFSLPLLLEYDYRAFRAGASIRLGPLYIGSNSICTFAFTRSVRDADIFVGLAFHDISGFSFKKNFKTWKARKVRGVQGCFSDF